MSDLNANIKKHRDNFIKKLNESGWKSLIPFIESDKFGQIVTMLYNHTLDGNRFTPKFRDTMNAFIECPHNKLNVVFVGQDPYPQQDVADGVSFSCSYTKKEQPSLRYIFDELQNQYPDADRNPDLRKWANQGVLMLNTAMTVQIGKIGSHYNIWVDWTRFLFNELNKRDDLIIVLLGKKAEAWELSLSNNIIYKVPHPASAAYKGGKWNSKELFKKINDKLLEQEKSLIVW